MIASSEIIKPCTGIRTSPNKKLSPEKTHCDEAFAQNEDMDKVY